MPELTRELDDTYHKLYAKIAHKQMLLKRNFSLILETTVHQRDSENAGKLNFRELVDTYLPACGLKGIDEALRQAETAETKLSAEERAVWGFSYYSPYFLNEAELQKVKFLTAVFFCAPKNVCG